MILLFILSTIAFFYLWDILRANIVIVSGTIDSINYVPSYFRSSTDITGYEPAHYVIEVNGKYYTSYTPKNLGAYVVVEEQRGKFSNTLYGYEIKSEVDVFKPCEYKVK